MIKSDNLIKKIIKEAKKVDPNDSIRRYPPLFLQRNEISINQVRKFCKVLINKKNYKIVNLYIHIPFCKKRCYFCKYPITLLSQKNFRQNKDILDLYLDLLTKEINLYQLNFKRISFNTLYIGGGTPTVLNVSQLNSLFNLIYKKFSFKKDAQILIEATPESLNYRKLKLLKQKGVNRLTIGIQSFNNKVLTNANRGHTVQEVYQAVDTARRAKIRHIHVDVIVGLPYETLKSYREAARGLIKLSPDSISLYPFDLNPLTIFYQKDKDFAQKYVEEGRMLKVIDALKSSGYRLFPSSAHTFIKDTEATNIQFHFKDQQESVLAIGCGASSQIEMGSSILYYRCTQDFKKYMSALRNQELPLRGIQLDLLERMRTYLFRNFYYYKKIEKEKFYKKYHKDLNKVFNKEIESLKKREIIVEDNNNLKICKEVSPEELFFNLIKYFFSDKMKKHCLAYFIKQNKA